MKRKKHTPPQILEKLRTVEAELSQGRTFVEIARKLEVSEQTLHRWRNQYGGVPGSPWENAYVESFHSRLRDEFLDRELFASLPEAKLLAIEYRAGYNQHRPHSSLGYLTPVEFAAAQHPSGSAAPSVLPTAGLRAPLRLREAAHQPQPTLISSGT